MVNHGESNPIWPHLSNMISGDTAFTGVTISATGSAGGAGGASAKTIFGHVANVNRKSRDFMTSWDFSSQQLWQLSEVQELYYYITYIHLYSRFHHISPTWGQLLDKFNHTMASYDDWDWIWLRKCGFMARLIEDYQWIELGASISGGIQKLPMVYHGKSH